MNITFSEPVKMMPCINDNDAAIAAARKRRSDAIKAARAEYNAVTSAASEKYKKAIAAAEDDYAIDELLIEFKKSREEQNGKPLN